MNRSPIYDGINEGVEKVQFDEFYSDIDIRCRGGNTINSFLDIFAVKPCRNVLIKGVFGVGKSTFCRKLMLEWCKVHKKTHEPEIENKSLTEMEEALFPFQYLFFVDQSKGDYSSIQEAILSSLSRLPDCQEMLKHIFKEKSQSVLIIVDGIDENPNIEFKGVNQSTVLMTTDQSHCDNICSKVDFTIDKVLTISGLNEEGISNLRYKIIQSYNKTSPHDNIESMSQECKEYLADLDLSRCFSNPFMLKTLVINWICGTISASETCNALAMLKQFVLRAKTKSPEKEQANLPSCESSIFEDTIPSHLRDKTLYPHGNVMLNLGAYAYRGLIDSSQSFNRPMREYDFNEHLRVDFERCSKSMGFLTKETYTPEQGEKEITLSFLHHHFEQFFTALWIVSKQCENGEWLFSSKDFVTDQNKKARILSFVCGLNSMLGSQLSRHVIEMVTNDKELNKFRLEQTSSDCQKARGQYIHRESILDKFKAVGIEDEEMFVEIVKDALKCLEKITDILLQCMTEVFHSSTPAEPLVIADVIQTNKPLTENLVQLLEQSNEQLLTLFLYGCTVDSFPNLQRLSEAVSESVHLKALAIEITQAEGINLAVNFNLSSLAELRTCDILLPGHYNCRITLGENGLLESFQCRGVQMTQQEWLDLFMHLCESPKLSLLHIENASTVPTDEHTNHPTVGTEAEEINLPTGFRMHMTTVELPTSIWQYIFQLPQMEHITLLELNNVHIDCVNLDKASHLVVLWMSDVQSTEVIFPKSNMLGELSVKKSTFRRQWSWSNLFASLTNEMKRIHLEAVDITAAVFSEQLCSNIEKVSLIDVSMTYFDNLKLILDQKDDGHFTSSQTGNVVNLEFEVGVGTGYSS